MKYNKKTTMILVVFFSTWTLRLGISKLLMLRILAVNRAGSPDILRSSDFPRGQMPARSLVLLNNSIIMQTQCCVKNKMSFILRKHSCGISIYNTKAYMVRIRPQFSHSTMLVFPATLLTTADGSII